MPDALQLCPHDEVPFFDVCSGHAKALESLGYRVRTIFFESRGPQRRSVLEPRFVYAAPPELPGIVGVDRPDLLVSHRHRAYRIGVRIARRLRIPTHIAVAHEFGMFSRSTRRLRRRLAGRGHALFAGVSEPVADDLGASGVESPVLLPNAIDARALRETMLERNQARAVLGVPSRAFAIGVVGRLHPKKDPLRPLGPFESYRRENSRACLVYLGDGPLRQRLLEEAGDGVVVAGFRANARTLLPAFDIVLLCSTDREAFGVILLEAMAAGIPVVVADRPGPRSVVGDCGAYFDTDDELLAALREIGSRQPAETVERARQRVSARFSATALAERYGGILVGSKR